MTKEIREAVYNKYNGRCAYCGREIAYEDMQVDHLISKVIGGADDLSNYMPSCRTCNHYKRDNSLEYFRKCISTIPCKLAERQYIYKVGMAYGFYDAEPKLVKFYFEEINNR